jgi:hypothetical protein
MVWAMSSELKTILEKVAEEDYEHEKTLIEERLEHFRSLLLKIAKARNWDFPVWIEGAEPADLKKYEADLNLLERANLVKGQMKYTEHNAYREYRLTKKGEELAKTL